MRQPAYLTLWRRKSRRELIRDKSIVDRLRLFLVQRLTPRDDEERALLDPMMRGNNCAQAALAFAARCSRRSEQPSDLAMSCVLLAALMISDLACLILAHALETRARRLLVDLERGFGNAPAVKREAAMCRRAAREWDEEVGFTFLILPSHWSNLFSQIARPSLAGSTAESPEASVPKFSGPTRVVINAVAANADGANWFDDTYLPLTEPLPLKGAEVDPERLRDNLLAEFPHLAAAIERIIGDFRLRHRAGVKWVRFRPLLLVGPPGIGKTRFAKRLAQLLGTGYGEVSGAGSSDDRMLRGTAHGWRDSQPALPLLIMLRTGCANPIFLVDEIDKAGGSERAGDIRQTLLAMLEPESSRAWFDEALLAPADLSGVSWILTANDIAPLSKPFLSRIAIVHTPAPGPEMFDTLFTGMLRTIADDLGVAVDALPPLAPAVREQLRRAFVEQPDLRRIKRAIESALPAGLPKLASPPLAKGG